MARDPEPEPLLVYRFTVKTDRDGNKRIERLAKACDVSPTIFVQRHFERIFGEQDAGAQRSAPAAEAEDEGPVLPAELPSARRHDDSDFDQPAKLTPALADMLKVMRDVAEPDGTLAISLRDLGRLCGCSEAAANGRRTELVDRGLVMQVRRGSSATPSVYRVVPEAHQRTAPSKPPGTNARRILDALRKAAAPDGTVRISYRDLGSQCCCSQESARQNIIRLRNRGLVAVVNEGGKNRTAVYRVLDKGAVG